MVKDVDDYYKIPEFVIDLNKQEYKGDMGLQDYCLDWVSYDTILLDMIDLEEGFKKVGQFLTATNSDIKAWRKGQVKMIGPRVKDYKVGDIVIFPGIHGLESGGLYITNESGEQEYVKHGHFLSEGRIFGKVHNIEE